MKSQIRSLDAFTSNALGFKSRLGASGFLIPTLHTSSTSEITLQLNPPNLEHRYSLLRQHRRQKRHLRQINTVRGLWVKLDHFALDLQRESQLFLHVDDNRTSPASQHSPWIQDRNPAPTTRSTTRDPTCRCTSSATHVATSTSGKVASATVSANSSVVSTKRQTTGAQKLTRCHTTIHARGAHTIKHIGSTTCAQPVEAAEDMGEVRAVESSRATTIGRLSGELGSCISRKAAG